MGKGHSTHRALREVGWEMLGGISGKCHLSTLSSLLAGATKLSFSISTINAVSQSSTQSLGPPLNHHKGISVGHRIKSWKYKDKLERSLPLGSSQVDRQYESWNTMRWMIQLRHVQAMLAEKEIIDFSWDRRQSILTFLFNGQGPVMLLDYHFQT